MVRHLLRVFERAVDGIRAFALVKDGRLTLQSRNRTTMSTWFPELAPIAELIDDAVIDGEIILGNGSVESFNTLLRRVRSRRPGPEPVTFVAFDVLEIDGINTTELPLDQRRERLQAIVKREDPRLVLSRVFDDGAALYAAALEHGLEGIVGKQRRSPYTFGRSRSWVRVKVPGAAERHTWTGHAD
jgi:bifunctional non-homologous end joining protein LigD